MTQTAWRVALSAFLAVAFILSALPAAEAKAEAETVPTGFPPDVNLYAVSWKPDGTEALAVGDNRAMATYKASSGKFSRVDAPEAPLFLQDVAWSPATGIAMAVGSDGGACLYNGREVTTVQTGTGKYLYGIDWFPDGTGALVAGADGTLLRYTAGVFTPLQTGVSSNLMAVSCRPTDGSALVVGLNSTFLRVAPDGSVAKLDFEGDWTLHSVAWDPQGTRAVITGGNGIVATYDGTAVSFVTRDTPNVFLDVCWRPDGSEALICGDTGIILRLREGRLAYIDSGIRSLLQGIAYRPDGSYLLAVGNIAKCVRYPKAPAAEAPGLLDNPLLLGAIVAVVAALIAFAAVKDRRDRMDLRRRGRPARDGRRARKKRK